MQGTVRDLLERTMAIREDSLYYESILFGDHETDIVHNGSFCQVCGLILFERPGLCLMPSAGTVTTCEDAQEDDVWDEVVQGFRVVESHAARHAWLAKRYTQVKLASGF